MVVGYQELNVPQGNCMKTSTFKAINGNYKVSDIKVSGALGGGSDTAQLMNADGSWGTMYTYLTEAEMGVPDGWYKDMFGDEAVTDEDMITVGQAFIVTFETDATFTVSGEVKSGTTPVDAPAGYSIIGNPTPVEVKISAITVSGALGGGSDTAQKMNSDGTWGDMYTYLTEAEMGVPDGWYKDMFGDEPVTDADTLAPGESMIFNAESTMTLTFPACL